MGKQRQGEWHVVSRYAFGVACVLSLSTALAGPPLADLGARLFADRALSADGTVACASCHRPDYAFADPRAVSTGVGGLPGTRNAPSLLGVATRSLFTWDGRTNRLATQTLVAFTHPREMGLADTDVLVERVTRNPEYRAALVASDRQSAFVIETVRAALTAYLATLSVGTSAFDRYIAGDTDALSPAARSGWGLFRGAAGCARCHRVEGPNASFDDDDFHRIGIGLGTIAPQLKSLTAQVADLSSVQLEVVIARDPAVAALGRFLVTRDPKDIGKYRTPSLRNVALTAPYMHDGSIATLDDAVDYEVNYVGLARDRPLSLTERDKADLVAFLQALSGQPGDSSPMK